MSVLDQIAFYGDVDCKFHPNMIKPNLCRNCMKDVSKHRRSQVDEKDVLKALEYSQKGERIPSLILEKDAKRGKLFLGGYKAVLNDDFLVQEDMKAIVNTVGKPLFQVFGKKFENSYKDGVSNHKISLLIVEWEDSIRYKIQDDDLVKVLRFVHEHLQSGESVLVHCAQGKSRSTTVVVAYLMTIMNMTVADALLFVKERRKMAEPNSLFMSKLHEYEKSELILQLREEFIS